VRRRLSKSDAHESNGLPAVLVTGRLRSHGKGVRTTNYGDIDG